jgi:hypothetical protein
MITQDSVNDRGCPHIRWMLTPSLLTELSDTYQAAEKLLDTKDLDERVLRRAYQHYLLLLERKGLYAEPYVQGLLNHSHHASDAEVRSLFHRVNCQVIRFLMGWHPCDLPCCCRCHAAPDDLACVSDSMITPVTQPGD